MSPIRYLTKARFRLACECPTRLFYTGKKEVYPDQSIAGSFPALLAEGGFQVAALAQMMYPDGVAVEARDLEEALAETAALMTREEVTIFDAAFRFKNLFIRIDILQKQGNVLDLIEVKARGIAHKSELIGRRSGKVAPAWKPHVMDVAFQDHVLRMAMPDAVIRPRLMLADQSARASVDGLNQHVKLIKDGGNRTRVQFSGAFVPEDLGSPILIRVNVHDALKQVKQASYRLGNRSCDFGGYIHALADAYEADTKIPPAVECGKCGKCSFTATTAEEQAGKVSGFKACWKEAMGFRDEDFSAASVMDLWKCTRKEAFRKTGRFFLRDLDAHDFDADKPVQRRQWMQVQKTVANDPEPWIDAAGLKDAMAAWRWPLHFIDFETSAVAIPFAKGRRPYEMIAFQFSHHVVHEDGRMEHADEYLNTTPGEFPNFEFIRRLKASLDQDDGTIFRYGAHENAVLNRIMQQLNEAGEDVPDRSELIDWIKTITQNAAAGWTGPRNMVDMCELVQKYYYQLAMGGSHSLRKVLSAVLNSSPVLQETYSQPVYQSQNFQHQTWVRRDEDDRVKDPCSLLPPVFADLPQGDLEKVPADGKFADSGAAVVAYARLQFCDMPEPERQTARQALLRYCELDSLAMVMIWEAWREAVG